MTDTLEDLLGGPDIAAAFFALHRDLPREGPGSATTTREAIRRLPAGLAARRGALRILDLGCGPGAASFLLAQDLGGRVTAVDLHRPFLDQLDRRARSTGLEERIDTQCGSFMDVDALPAPVDLIWAEGSIYCVGVTEALTAWKPLLAAGGVVSFSDAVWLTDAPAAAVREFWAEGYPAIRGIAGTVAKVETAGYRILDLFVQPASDWWDAYFKPLEDRMVALEPAADAVMRDVIAMQRQEIDIWRQHGDAFSYAFMIAEPVL